MDLVAPSYILERLLPNHLEDLRRSGLSEKTILSWGPYSFKTDQSSVLTQLGFPDVKPPALALPILRVGIVKPNRNDVIVKPDRPRIDRGRAIPYERPRNSTNYVHAPLACRQLLADPAVPLWITFGPKQAEKAAQEGLCCIAVPAYGNEQPGPSDVSLPLSDFDLFPLTRKILLIVSAAENPAALEASRQLAEFLARRGADVYRVTLPGGVNFGRVGLDDFLVSRSVRELEQLPQEKIRTELGIEVRLNELSAGSGSAQVEQILRLIASLENELERESALKTVASRTGFRIALLREQVVRFRGEMAGETASSQEPELLDSDREEALDLLKSKNILEQFLAAVEKLGCAGQEKQKIFLKLAANAGRLTDDPINTTIKGESAAGKNFLLDAVLETEPPEDLLDVSRMTAKALQYWPDSLKHKLLTIAEAPGIKDAEFTIRVFQSEKQFRVWVVEREGGRMVTREHVVEGPAGFFETTTETHLHAENEARTFDVYIDESEEQTRRIFAKQDELRANPMSPKTREAVLRRWRNAARLLVPLPVLIPFVGKLNFPTKPLRVRRDRPRFLSLIQASALFHQYQRETVERDGQLFLVASSADYAIARDLAIDLLDSALAGATPKCVALVAWAQTIGGQFTKSDVDRAMDWSRKTALKYLAEAVGLGSIEMNRATVPSSTTFFFVRPVQSPLIDLPLPDALG